MRYYIDELYLNMAISKLSRRMLVNRMYIPSRIGAAYFPVSDGHLGNTLASYRVALVVHRLVPDVN